MFFTACFYIQKKKKKAFSFSISHKATNSSILASFKGKVIDLSAELGLWKGANKHSRVGRL